MSLVIRKPTFVCSGMLISLCRTYSDCCVDDVNASHLTANDMIIHFGRCCLSTASDAMNQVEMVSVGLEGDEMEADGNPVGAGKKGAKEEIKKEILYVMPRVEATSETWVKLAEGIRSQVKED